MGNKLQFNSRVWLDLGKLAVNTGEKIAGILNGFGVKTVFRLNKQEYDRTSFTRAGIEHFDFYYTDGTVPDEVRNPTQPIMEFCQYFWLSKIHFLQF